MVKTFIAYEISNRSELFYYIALQPIHVGSHSDSAVIHYICSTTLLKITFSMKN